METQIFRETLEIKTNIRQLCLQDWWPLKFKEARKNLIPEVSRMPSPNFSLDFIAVASRK